ncbi:MAG: GTPase [Pirellulaceae bacterium]
MTLSDSRPTAQVGRALAARLTANAPAAIATIAVSGPGAEATVLQFVRLSTQQLAIGDIYYGQWLFENEGHQHAAIQATEQVVVCQTIPGLVEVHCHGGQAVCRGILDDLQTAGCEIVAAEQLNRRRGIARAAELQLLKASTDRSAAILLDQATGALEHAITTICQLISAGNYADAHKQIDALLRWSRLGLHLAEPWRVVLAGPPNVGKSSLINAIVGSQQSIVHHEAGTTRDWVEANCAFDGWPICLSDTAGIRASEDEVEAAGVVRAQEQIAQADLLIAVVDGTCGWTETHAQLTSLTRFGLNRGHSQGQPTFHTESRLPVVVAWNKSDLEVQTMPDEALDYPVCACSAVGQPGVETLLQQVVQILVPLEPAVGTAVPFLPEYVSVLSETRDLLVSRPAETELIAKQLVEMSALLE